MKMKVVYWQIIDFKKIAKAKNPEKKTRKNGVLENFYALFEGREWFLGVFKSKIFPLKVEGTGFSDKVINHSNPKILTPKQMLQRLQIALAQVKAGSTSKYLLNKIRQIIYSLFRAKKLPKNYITTNSIKL